MAQPANAVRKMLLVASAAAVPLSILATTGVAASKPPPPDPAVICSLGGTFEMSGISKDGFAGFSALMLLENDNIGGGCIGSGSPSDVSDRVKCDKHTPGLPASNPACVPKTWGYNSWANVTDGTLASAIQNETVGHFGWSFFINGIEYYARSTSSSTVHSGGLCGSSEIGFQEIAKVALPRNDRSQTMTITDCLGAITGDGLNPGDNFYDASVDQIGTVVTAAIDPATSSVHIG
jgi:hypothetical protein